MSTIDLVVIGMIKKQPQSAYELQKNINYRNIDRWVSISTPSIYKKVIQLEIKGYLSREVIQQERLDKTIYKITESGEAYFQVLMKEIAQKPIGFYLDFDAVILHMDVLEEAQRQELLQEMLEQINVLQQLLKDNIDAKPHIPERGKLILHQQYTLANDLKEWFQSLDPKQFS